MSRAASTQKKILDVAERLVMQRGYHAFSYQHIADELGVRAPAIHYHFRTKPTLVVAVLQRYTRRFVRWAAQLEGQTCVEQLDAYIDVSRIFLAQDRICAAGAMAADFRVVPEPVQAVTAAFQDELWAWLNALLERGRVEGVFHFDGPAKSRAAELACAMNGAQQYGRLNGPPFFEQVAAQIRRSLLTPKS
jgi:TetR/AcrR family transcriptional regulator, transcriptional repressor for nem operon